MLESFHCYTLDSWWLDLPIDGLFATFDCHIFPVSMFWMVGSYHIISHHVASYHISCIIYPLSCIINHISYFVHRISYIMESYIIESYIIESYIIFHISYLILIYFITSHHITSHHITSYHTTWYHIILYHTISKIQHRSEIIINLRLRWFITFENQLFSHKDRRESHQWCHWPQKIDLQVIDCILVVYLIFCLGNPNIRFKIIITQLSMKSYIQNRGCSSLRLQENTPPPKCQRVFHLI